MLQTFPIAVQAAEFVEVHCTQTFELEQAGVGFAQFESLKHGTQVLSEGLHLRFGGIVQSVVSVAGVQAVGGAQLIFSVILASLQIVNVPLLFPDAFSYLIGVSSTE